MKSNSVFVADCGGNIIVCNHSFETKKGQRYFTNNGNSPMGFSFSGAMGAYFANTKRPVICVIGDGGMNMNIKELQTIKNYNIKGVINLGAKDKISKGKFLFKIGKKLNTKRKFTFQNVENLNLKAYRPKNMLMCVKKVEMLLKKPMPSIDEGINDLIINLKQKNVFG